MEDIGRKYAKLAREFGSLQEIQCIYANNGLEKIMPDEEVSRYSRLGVYNPDFPFPLHSIKELDEVQLKMFEVLSSMADVYDQLLVFNPGLAENFKPYHENAIKAKSELGEIVREIEQKRKLEEKMGNETNIIKKLRLLMSGGSQYRS